MGGLEDIELFAEFDMTDWMLACLAVLRTTREANPLSTETYVFLRPIAEEFRHKQAFQ